MQYEPEPHPDNAKDDNNTRYLLPARLFDVRLKPLVVVSHYFWMGRMVTAVP